MMKIRRWLNTQIAWLKAWRALEDLKDYSAVGADITELVGEGTFQTFQVRVKEAATLYESGDLPGTATALLTAWKIFRQLKQTQQRQIVEQLARAKHLQHHMQVAELCQ